MCELEERTENHDGSAPTVGVVQEGLSRNAVHPLLQTVDDIVFTILSHRKKTIYENNIILLCGGGKESMNGGSAEIVPCLTFESRAYRFFLPFCLVLDELAMERTQRKPM